MTAAFYRTDDLRIKWTKVVLPPVFLEEQLPATEQVSSTIYHAATRSATFSLAGIIASKAAMKGPAPMGVFAYWGILCLALIGWFSLRREKSALAQEFVFYVLLITALHLPFNMNTRYRIPLMDPLLVVLGANTIATLANRRSGRATDMITIDRNSPASAMST